MLSPSDIAQRVSPLLEIDGSDARVNEYVAAAISKLKSEGVNIADIDAEHESDYILCVAYQVQLDIDVDVPRDRLLSLYLTRVNTLRSYLAVGAAQ
jgi:hypothetical protein